MAIRNSTLQLKARVTGSSCANAVPHMAQPCARAVAGTSAVAIAAIAMESTGSRRRTTIRMFHSVEVDQREEEDPEPADEIPVDRAHLEAGRRAPPDPGPARQERERAEPDDGDQDVHEVAADQEIEGAAVDAGTRREAVRKQA